MVALTRIDRHPPGKFALIKYAEDDGGIRRFEDRSVELLAGYVFLTSAQSKVRADIFFEDGLLVAIKFNRRPSSLNSGSISINDARFLLAPGEAEASNRSPDGPLLSKLASAGTPTSVGPPASNERREVFISRLETPLPAEYVALLAETDSFTVGDKVFEGTHQRTIVWPDQSLQLVFENQEQTLALCFVEGTATPEVFLLDQIAHELTPWGDDFVDAAIRFIRLQC